MYNTKSIVILIIYIVFYNATPTISKNNFCYTPTFLELSWTDRRPEFKLNMTFSNQGFIRLLNWLERDILSPITSLVIMQKDCCDKTITLYNITTRLCDFPQIINKLPMFKETILKALKPGNYTLECPLKRGLYVMDNIRINSRNPILAFMYRPSRIFTFMGGLYEETANKSLMTLTTYRFSVKIVKKLCKDL